jgi:hypothetical protein
MSLRPIKLFVSHASEDKTGFVDPLVEALKMAGYDVWYDKFELTIGDSLLQKIGQGLKECDYGVVVLSPDFFRKKWTQAELDGLFALETTERKVILPIWKDVTVDDVKAFSPILAGRLGAPTSGGFDSVVAEISRAVQAAERVASFSNVENAISRFKSLDQEVGGTKRAKAVTSSVEGVRLVLDAVGQLIGSVRSGVDELSTASENLQIKLGKVSDTLFSFDGSYRLHFVLSYRNNVTNSIERAELILRICQLLDPLGEDYSKRRDIFVKDFIPEFHHTGKLIWKEKRDQQEFTTEQFGNWILDEIVDAFAVLFRNPGSMH